MAWSPVPFYEANRRGAIMTFPDQASPYAQEFRSGDYHAILVGRPRQDDLRVLDGWAWIGSVSPHILRFGDNRTFVAAAPVVAASVGPRGWVKRTSVLQGSSSLRCNGSPLRLPSTQGSIGVWFTKPNGRQHFWVTDRFAALPVRNVAVITAGAFGNGQERALRCQGGGSLGIAQITTFPSLEGRSAGA